MTDVKTVLGSSRIAVLSPHSDDAALSLGGTLSLAALQGLDCSILTLFSRSRRTRTGGIEADEARVTAMRKAEDRAFADLVGGAQCAWCDLPDPSVRLPEAREQWYAPRPLSEQEYGYVSDVVEFVRAHSDGCLILAPAGLGANRDHLIVRAAALEMGRAAGHAVMLYEDLPYAARVRGRDLNGGIADLADREGMGVEARTVSHASLYMRKRRALMTYRSQINRDIMNRVLCHSLRVGGLVTFGERVWCMSPAASTVSRACACEALGASG
jgi:LmbE family N-acetylglucosaminyl deacetylase